MGVRARMFVQSVTKQAGDTGIANLGAVSRGEHNKEWASYTPSANVSLNLSNKATPALKWFEDRVGKEVYMDFTDAEPDE